MSVFMYKGHIPVCGLPPNWLGPGSVLPNWLWPNRSPRCRRATTRLKNVGTLINQLTISKTLMSKAVSLLNNQIMSNNNDTPTKPENWRTPKVSGSYKGRAWNTFDWPPLMARRIRRAVEHRGQKEILGGCMLDYWTGCIEKQYPKINQPSSNHCSKTHSMQKNERRGV